MIYEDKIEQVTLRISSSDMGGGSHIPASDILIQMINESSHINLLALVEVKDVHLTLKEIDEDEAFALAQEADGGDFTPYQNSGSWDLEGDPVLEPTPYQDYLKDKQKKWWGYDKHMRLTEVDEEEA